MGLTARHFGETENCRCSSNGLQLSVYMWPFQWSGNMKTHVPLSSEHMCPHMCWCSRQFHHHLPLFLPPPPNTYHSTALLCWQDHDLRTFSLHTIRTGRAELFQEINWSRITDTPPQSDKRNPDAYAVKQKREKGPDTTNERFSWGRWFPTKETCHEQQECGLSD